ncbi:symmetrical bis(5'-nucleosyl)-tetraphosphatase [Aliidiomarina sp. Khilg15.8]
MALYIVGDIHGCADEFDQLLAQVSFDPRVDTLWCVGDLVGRGPEPLRVLKRVRALGDACECVAGNHDLHLLSVLCGVKPYHAGHNTQSILDAPDRQEWIDWLRHLPLMVTHADKPVVMAHAGIYPGWDLATARACSREAERCLQSENFTDYLSTMYANEPKVWSSELDAHARFRFIVNSFTRMRFCSQSPAGIALELKTKTAPDQSDNLLQPWFNFWPKLPIQVAFGHWAALNGKSSRDDVVALDTGCVWGNQLTLWDYDNNRLYHQPAIDQN